MPVFVRVNVVAPDVVATGWLPKPKLPGVRLAFGSTPLPVRLTDWPSSVSVPLRVPRAVGANVTLSVHVLFGAAFAPGRSRCNQWR